MSDDGVSRRPLQGDTQSDGMLSLSALVGDRFMRGLEFRLSSPAEIRLRAVYEASGSEPDVLVRFTDVMAFLLDEGRPDTVLFDIEEQPLTHFVQQREGLFEAKRNYGWPCRFASVAELPSVLANAQVRAFEIQSTRGTHGWVLARDVHAWAEVPARGHFA